MPQALEGVAAVGLLYATVRRWSGPVAGPGRRRRAGADPGRGADVPLRQPRRAARAAHGRRRPTRVTRALEQAGTRWLLLAGVAHRLRVPDQDDAGLPGPARVRAGLPGRRADRRCGRRIGQVLAARPRPWSSPPAGGCWPSALWPASSRPYIGGSTDNTVLNLVFGYNGLGRLFGSAGNGGGGGGGDRRLQLRRGDRPRPAVQQRDGQRDLLAAAGRAGRPRRRAVGHPPGTAHRPHPGRADPVGRLADRHRRWSSPTWRARSTRTTRWPSRRRSPRWSRSAARPLWRRRDRLTSRIGLAAIVAAAGGWSYVLLARTASWHPELRYLVAGLTVLTAVGLLVAAGPRRPWAGRRRGWWSRASWPASSAPARSGWPPRPRPTPAASPASARPRRRPAAGGGMGGGARAARFGGGTAPSGTASDRPAAGPAAEPDTEPAGRHGNGTGGGMGGTTSTSTALVTALKATTTTWAAAVVGDQSAADLDPEQRQGRHGDRRMERKRQLPHPGPVRAVRGRRQDPLLHRQRHRRGHGRQQRRRCPDHRLGQGPLHGDARSAVRPSTT